MEYWLGVLNKHGLQCPVIDQVHRLVEASIARKQGDVLGEGKNHWPNVDVDESMSLFIISRTYSPSYLYWPTCT